MNGLEVLALMRIHAVDHDRGSVTDWADVLATFPLFSGLSRRRLRKLVRGASFAEFAAGETVLLKGDSSDSLYVILGGGAKAVRRHQTRELAMGDYFGEFALISGAPRSATVVATEELFVMRLPARSVLQLAQKDPDITLAMLRNLSTQLLRLESQVALRDA
jgi:CRP/FNR family transcriptional regulator, cyclic AMP receptor protein